MDNLLTILGITFLLGILIWVLSLYRRKRTRKRTYYVYWHETKPLGNAAFMDHGEELIEAEDQFEAQAIFKHRKPGAEISMITELS